MELVSKEEIGRGFLENELEANKSDEEQEKSKGRSRCSHKMCHLPTASACTCVTRKEKSFMTHALTKVS